MSLPWTLQNGKQTIYHLQTEKLFVRRAQLIARQPIGNVTQPTAHTQPATTIRRLILSPEMNVVARQERMETVRHRAEPCLTRATPNASIQDIHIIHVQADTAAHQGRTKRRNGGENGKHLQIHNL